MQSRNQNSYLTLVFATIITYVRSEACTSVHFQKAKKYPHCSFSKSPCKILVNTVDSWYKYQPIKIVNILFFCLLNQSNSLLHKPFVLLTNQHQCRLDALWVDFFAVQEARDFEQQDFANVVFKF